MAALLEGHGLALLEGHGLSRRFGDTQALDNVSFAIEAGEIHALVGENGAGKSTLVGLLTGQHAPDAGEILLRGQPIAPSGPREAQALGIALVAQELSICPALSVLDNIWLGHRQVGLFHRGATWRARAAAALDRLGAAHIGLDTPAHRLSLGERQLVEIARMLARDAEILLLDEPSATLSDVEIARMMSALRALKAEGRAVIYITHRLGEVFALCDRATVLRNGSCVGTWDLKNLTRDDLITAMLGRQLETLYPQAAPHALGGGMVLSGLTVPGTLAALDLHIPAGSVTCLAGQVGSGAEAALRAAAGLEYTASGRVTLTDRPIRLGIPEAARRAGILFVSGDRAREGIFRDLTARANLVATRLPALSRAGVLNPVALRRAAASLAQRVGVARDRLGAPAGNLSGGNQQKLAFGRCLDQGPHSALVMIEPTRGVDVGARADIYRLLRGFCDAGHPVLVATTDLEEALGISDTIVTLYRGRVVGTYRHGEVALPQLVADITHPLDAAA